MSLGRLSLRKAALQRFKMKKIIAAGHICLDITPVIPATQEKRPLEQLLAPGKLLHVSHADIHSGGSVANTGLALKLLGEDVTLMGKIGNDAFGSILRDQLARHGVGGLLTDPDSETSYSVVLAPPGVDRIFLHNPGANDSFSSTDIPDDMLEGAALFHFGYPPLMKRMYENDGEELSALFRRIKEKQIATSLDLAGVDPDSEAGKADWEIVLSRVLPDTDFFLPSFEELCFMLDRRNYYRLKEPEGAILTDRLDFETDVEPLAKRALSMGCRVVVIKCGTRGILFHTAGKEAVKQIGSNIGIDAALWADKAGIQPCFCVEDVRSATGAGDAAIAAFLSAVVRGYSPEECVQFAAAEGACSVTGYDALSGILTLPELEKKIRAGWPTR